jgi:hypothetical protein
MIDQDDGAGIIEPAPSFAAPMRLEYLGGM